MSSNKDYNLETLIKALPLEKTHDFIQFRTTFMNNFDFERVRELASTQQIKRTGSRTTAWKVSFFTPLALIPPLNSLAP